MRPVALLQHDRTQRPALLLDYLNETGIPSVTFTPQEGQDVPRSARDFSGMVLLGSQHSVNDRLPWIEQELLLIQDAMARDVPVLGHSFGGRLLARAMGASVSRIGWPSIGWCALHVTPSAKPLFGNACKVMAFNWHREAFAVPRGALRTLFGTHCLNEGFSHGKHLAFQCHLELTEEIVRDWCRAGRTELAQADGRAVQHETQILANMPDCLPLLHQVARSVYGQWVGGLVRPTSALCRSGR